jgi:glycosyltransferase involved in cell wall biosynthesis
VSRAKLKISPIICTHNRAAYLPQAIRSLMEQSVARDDYEIIVIDNGSTDATREVTNSLMREAPNLRYVHESNAGLSCARNRGIKEAAAPIVAFLDDDAIAANNWLAAILDAFAIAPRPDCVGGPVEPWWEVPKPSWFPASLLGCHRLDYGPRPHWCNYPSEHPIGCNMAFIKKRVDQVGGFNVLLQKYNDETELMRRIVEADGRIYYEPRARVRHLVAKDRLSLGWQMRRHYYEGVSLAVAALSNARPARPQRVRELGHNLLLIALKTVRLVVSRGTMTERIQRLAQLTTLVGTSVYLAKSLHAK